MTVHSWFLINCKRIQGTAEEYLPRGESNCQLKNVNPAKPISPEQSKIEIFQGSTTVFHPQIFGKEYTSRRTSLVFQWLRIRLPVHGTQVWSLIQEDSTCCGATKPVHCNYWSPSAVEPMLHNRRSRCNEKPVHYNWRVALEHGDEDPMQQKIKKFF